jgi:purine nucleosidase/pyrimidine-specific ribonucleoside hydrolase
VHGEDGLGELWRYRAADGTPRYQPVSAAPTALDAASCLLDLIRRFPGELTLITLGPLTNVAHALRRDAAVMRQLVRVVMMGGAVAVPGNITPAAEFNIFVDPEAAQAVFTSGLPLSLVGLDVTERVRLTAELIEERVRPLRTPLSQFIVDCTGKAIGFSRSVERPVGMAMHDPLAVGAVIDPSLVRSVPLPVQVETRGEWTAGMTLADRRPLRADLKAPANVHVALDVEATRFLDLFLARLRTP